VVVNSYYKPFPNLKVTAQVYNLDMTVKFSRQAALDVAADSSTRAFTLPEIDGLSSTYFVSLALEEPSGNSVSGNFYWLSAKPETLTGLQEAVLYPRRRDAIFSRMPAGSKPAAA
jgi:exo-1,4-beta-D-glucosaminidase